MNIIKQLFENLKSIWINKSVMDNSRPIFKKRFEMIKTFMYKVINIKKTDNYFYINNISLVTFIPKDYFSKVAESIGIVWENEIRYWDEEKKRAKLLKAALTNQYRLALALLKNGVSVNIQDSNGNSPLHRAAYKGHCEMLELFIEHSADVEMSTIPAGNKALHRAAYNGRTYAVKFLLNKCGADIEARCRYDHTPVFAAAHYGHYSTLEYLVSRNANLLHINELDQSILHVVAHKCKKDEEKIINFLINNNVDIESKDRRGYTPLHSASYFGSFDNVKTLRILGANQESMGNCKFSPLFSAILGCQPDIIKYLLETGSYWDIESNGPEKICDVLERSKLEVIDTDDLKQLEKWEKAKEIIYNWLNSAYEELFFQKMFLELLNLPIKITHFDEFSGWLQAESIKLPVKTLLFNLRIISTECKIISNKYRNF